MLDGTKVGRQPDAAKTHEEGAYLCWNCCVRCSNLPAALAIRSRQRAHHSAICIFELLCKFPNCRLSEFKRPLAGALSGEVSEMVLE